MEKNEFDEIQQDIIQYVKTMKFKRKLIGGIDEDDVLKKIEELNALYETALLCERSRYNALLEKFQKGGAEK